MIFTHTYTPISDSFVVLNQRITFNFYDNFFPESSARPVVHVSMIVALSLGSGVVEFTG